jgi:hypothetical protein
MSGLLQGRSQHVGPARLLAFGVVGFAVGAMLGYIFMGTVHAVCLPARKPTFHLHSSIGVCAFFLGDIVEGLTTKDGS